MEEQKKYTHIVLRYMLLLCIVGIFGYILFADEAVDDLVFDDEIDVRSSTQIANARIVEVEEQVKGEQIAQEIDAGDFDTQQTDLELEYPQVFSANILNTPQLHTVQAGQDLELQILAKNTGTEVWNRDAVSVNVVGGAFANAVFRHTSWLTDLRTTYLDQAQVGSGENATFSFRITAPSQTGTYTFQTMLVSQDGFLFERISENIFSVTLTVLDSDVQLDIPFNKPSSDFDLDMPVETSPELSVPINKNTTTPSYSGGSSGFNQPSDIHDEGATTSTEDASPTTTPTMTITLTTTTIYTASSSLIISGTYSTGTSHILVNDVDTDTVTLDNGVWSFTAVIENTTNTFTFTAVDATYKQFSTPHTITIIRLISPQSSAIPEIGVNLSTSTVYTSTSSNYLITGTLNTSTAYIWVNGTSTDAMVLDMDTYSWKFSTVLEPGDNEFVFSAWDEAYAHETKNLYLITYVEQDLESEDTEEENTPEIVPPTLVWPTTSSTYSTSSPSITIWGTYEDGVDSVVVFNSTTQQYIQSVIMTSSTWEISLDLFGVGEYDFEIYGITHGVTSSPTYIQITRMPGEAVLNEFNITSNATSITFNLNSVFSEYVSLEFSVAPDETYNDAVCGEDVLWYETSDISVLSSLGQFMELFLEHECIRFMASTTQDLISVEIDPAFEYVFIDARAQAIGASNTSSWVYASQSWGVDSGGPEVFPEGSVVLSEVAWMGTSASTNDEWFEVCNVDSVYIDLSGWRILFGVVNLTVGSVVLAPSDCWVFERTDQTTILEYTNSTIYTGSLSNGGEHVELYSSLGNLMDEVNSSAAWFAGDNTSKDSMVRINPNISGNESDNWCSFSSCPDASLKGYRNGLDANGVEILGSVGNMEVIEQIL